MPVLVVFLAVGFGETVGQVLLIRELLVNFQGNELSLGVILAYWLLMMALGSWGLGKFAEKLPARPSAFVFTVVLYAFILISQLLLARLVNAVVGVKPGEVFGLASIFYACLIVLTPLCLLHGFQFPFACRILAQGGTAPVQVGRVYIAEALGSMSGGALFTYFLVHYFDHLEIAVFTVIFNLAAGLFLLSPLLSLRFVFRKLVVCSLCLAAIISLATGALSRLDFVFSQWQWRGHELVSSRNSVYQNIAVTRKGEQFNFFANGALLFTTLVPDIKFVEEIAHFPLLHHFSPKNVLLIGSGMGGVLDEIIKHPVDSVFYVEPDPWIIQTAENYLPASPLEDARIKVEYTDGRLFVERTTDRFDVVIMNLPPPSTLQVNRFYTREFFANVRGVLDSQDGILAFGVPSSEAYMSEEMIRLNRSIFNTLKDVFPSVSVIPNDFTIFLASTNPVLLTQDTGELCRRLEERGLETKLFTSHYIEYKLLPERISRLTAYLYEASEINQDTRPISTFHNLALWNTMFHPGLKGIFDLALGIKLWWFLLLLPLFFVPVLRNMRQKRFPLSSVVLALFTTGFAGMTFTIVLLFAFQVSYGHLYQKIGILIAAFMLGLALGGWTMNRIMEKLRKDVLTLGWLELTVALYALSLPWIVQLLSRLSTIPGEVPFSLLNLAAGFIVGLEFPLAGKIYLQVRTDVAPTVGLLYAADLWGSILGALLTAVLFIPVLGIVNTCLVAAATPNLVTFAALFISARLCR